MKKETPPAEVDALAIHKQLLKIAADEIARLPEHLAALTPAERVRFVLSVLPYTAPRVDKIDAAAVVGLEW